MPLCVYLYPDFNHLTCILEEEKDHEKATGKPAKSGHMHRRDLALEGSKLTGNHMNSYNMIRIVIVTE